jgi:hypothetical protein
MRHLLLRLLLSLIVLVPETSAASTHAGLSPREEDFSSRSSPGMRTEVTIYKVVYGRSTNFSDETELPAGLLHRLADEVAQETGAVPPLCCVKFSDITNMQDLVGEIKRSLRDDKSYEVDFSSSDLHDDWLEAFVDMMLSHDMRRYVGNIECINLNSNFIGIAGLQSLIPLLRLDTLRVVDLSNTAIDEEQLEVFGSSNAYNQHTSERHRIILSDQERETIFKKLIWIPKSFIDAQDRNKNPSGIFVTPEVIRRHREYYKLAY